MADLPEFPSYPLVQIEWVDHCSEDAWESIEAAKADTKLHLIRTVGWMVLETDTLYQVVQNVSTDGECCMRMVLMKGTVRSFKVLRPEG